MKLSAKEKADELLNDWKKWEDCIRSFISANHLTKEFDKHVEDWERERKLPLTAFERDFQNINKPCKKK